MNKRTMKIISIITIVLCILMSLSTCFAALTTDSIDTEKTISDDQLAGVGSSIATIVRNVGVVLAVVILMVLGIKYMMGSAEEKAEYKKTMIPYLVGAILLFGASAIAGMVVSLSGSITGGN